MKEVWKFEIPINDYFELVMPEKAKILYVDVQKDLPCLWALVDPEPNHPKEKRKFRFAGTGHPITQEPETLIHIGSFQMNGGDLIFHIFEIKIP